MENVIIFGTGSYYLHRKNRINPDYNIVAFVDNNPAKIGTEFEGLPVLSPDRMCVVGHSKVVIASTFKYEILNQLLDMEIDADKIDFLSCFSLCEADKIKTKVNASDRSVIFNVEGIRYKCISKSDFIVLSDTYEGVYNFNVQKEIVVIDIGMNIGITPLFFAKNSNVSKVYAFEPFTETYNKAVDNFLLNDKSVTDKIIPYNIGLGKENIVKEFIYNPEYSAGMSVTGDGVNDTNGKNVSKIEVSDASSILKQIVDDNQGKLLCLKSDCEGSEYDIFESLTKVVF